MGNVGYDALQDAPHGKWFGDAAQRRQNGSRNDEGVSGADR